MGREEQIEEREVLDSIFPEEIQGMLQFNGSYSGLNNKTLTRALQTTQLLTTQ